MFSTATLVLKKAASRGAQSAVRGLLDRAGVEIDGSAPHDLEVRDPRFYARVLRDGSLGLGETYMEGWWESRALDETITRLLRARLDRTLGKSWARAMLGVQARLTNLQSLQRAGEVGRRHYDIGNDLYRAMLDARLVYTCAYFKETDDLDAAQEAKLDLVCRKVGLRPGMRVLDLGCGWGSFARYAAQKYNVEVTGYTISEEQAALGREMCTGLPVDIRLEDYRQATGTYDAVISIGIMEHVGPKNYGVYMDVVDRCLARDGVAFAHTITGNRSTEHTDPWMHRYIFPNAVLPSLANITRAMEERFVVEDVHNIGPHYDRTLMAWHRRFQAAWPELEKNYDQRFYRMWRYYLLASAGLFRARHAQLHQIVFTRPPTPQPPCRLS